MGWGEEFVVEKLEAVEGEVWVDVSRRTLAASQAAEKAAWTTMCLVGVGLLRVSEWGAAITVRTSSSVKARLAKTAWVVKPKFQNVYLQHGRQSGSESHGTATRFDTQLWETRS